MRLFSKSFFILIFAFWILHFGFANARPRKGFVEGPYLALAGGVLQFDWDKNQRTQIQEGGSYEPMIALLFGWNVNDWWGPELELRYATDKNGGRREHIAGANVGAVFTLLLDNLTDPLGKWRILPFLRPGIGYQIATLPGDPLTTKQRLISQGVGPSIGGGIRFTFKKFLYLGIEAQEEFLWHDSHYQVIPGLGNTLIYDGGLGKQFQAFTMVGVHY